MSLSFKMTDEETLKLLKKVPQTKLAEMLEQSQYEERTSADQSEDDETEIFGIETKSEAEYSREELMRVENYCEIDKIESKKIKTIEIHKMPLCELPLEATLPLVKLKNFVKGNQLQADIKAWHELEQPKRKSTVLYVHESIKKNVMPNVKIKIDEAEFDCHYLLLICYSDYFMAKPMKNDYEVSKDDVTPAAFASIYKWMLSDDAQVESENILEVLLAANYLGIDDLKHQIWYCIESQEYFVEHDAFLLFLEAKKLTSISFIENIMLSRISKFFMPLLTTKEFFDLSAQNVATLLASDNIAVNTEKEVFYAAILWLNHDWQSRQTHIKEVMASVRMNALPTSFLISLRHSTHFRAVNRIILNESFKKLLSESIFGRTLIAYSNESQEYTKMYKEFNVKKPQPRVFFYDKNCSYHKTQTSEGEATPDYSQFINYLHLLQLRD